MHRIRTRGDEGGTMAGVLVTLLVLAIVAVGAFFYLGGDAEVDVQEPNVDVTADPNTPDADVTTDN